MNAIFTSGTLKRANKELFAKTVTVVAWLLLESCGVSPSFYGMSPTSSLLKPKDSNAQALEMRQSTIDPETAKVTPIVKLLLVIDDSTSMTSHRANFARGIGQMVHSITQARSDLDIALITTTNIVTPTTQNIVDGKVVTELPNIAHKRVTTYGPGHPIYGKYYQFRRDSNVTETAERMLNDIRGLDSRTLPVGADVKDTEMGICSALRVLNDRRPEGFVKKGDKFLVVFFSDEDSSEDNSNSLTSCLLSTEQEWNPEIITFPETTRIKCERKGDPECAQFTAFMYLYSQSFTMSNRRTITLNFTYKETTYSDGVTIGTTSKQSSVSWTCQEGDARCSQNSADASGTTVCNQKDLNEARSGLGFCIYNPRSCAAEITTCTATKVAVPDHLAIDSVTTLQPDDTLRCPFTSTPQKQYTGTCSQTFAGNYKDVPTGKNISSSQMRPAGTPVNFQAGGTIAFTSDQFHNKATEMFGRDGYRTVAIIRDKELDGSKCPAQSNDVFSYGLRYRELVTRKSSGGQSTGSIYSLCTDNFSPALTEAQKFIYEVLSSTHIKVDMKSNESVGAVYVIRGQDKILAEPRNYTVASGSIEFIQNLLKPGDKILVELKAPKS